MRIIKKAVLFIILGCLSTTLFSQTEEQKKEKSVKLYGFIRNYYYYDNRANFNATSGLTNKEPKDEVLNELGEDLNGTSSSNLLAISTRLGLDITGPQILDAASSGKIEMDFCGFSSNTYLIRLRQAYMKLNWENHALLLGQTWHPMAVDVIPEVLSMAAGAPFNPLNRSPQLQYTFNYHGLQILAAALYQLQYTSTGPDGLVSSYLTNGNIPELMLSMSYKRNGFLIGASLDYLSLRPRIKGTDIISINVNGTPKDSAITRLVDDRAEGFSPSIYLGYSNKLLSIKAKSIYGQNITHLNMLGGYGVTKENADGEREYAPIRTSSSWLNISYGKKYKISLFAGYYKNLGSNKDFLDTKNMLYERDCTNIDQMYRITPIISYNLKHFNFGIEYELNAVDYGEVEKDGKVKNTHTIFGHRICSMVKYNF